MRRIILLFCIVFIFVGVGLMVPDISQVSFADGLPLGQLSTIEYPEPGAPQESSRVVYYDSSYSSSKLENSTVMKDYFVNYGFIQKNAAGLQTWMAQRVASQTAYGTVCVMSQDVVPYTITETAVDGVSPSTSCTLKQYLDAGGKIVWVGDNPLQYRWDTTNGVYDWTTKYDYEALGTPIEIILGVSTKYIGEEGEFESRVTDFGAAQGILSSQTLCPANIDQVNNVLALNYYDELPEADPNNLYRASAWFRNYNHAYPDSGFYRWYDSTYDGANEAYNDVVLRLLVYGVKPNKILKEKEDKVVYYDSTFPGTANPAFAPYLTNSTAMKDYFVQQGFVHKDGKGLQAWMKEQLCNGTAPDTVCVMSQDIVPSDITETKDAACTLRKYLNAGGRVVWVGDVQLLYRWNPLNPAVEVYNGSESILGVGYSSTEGIASVITKGGTEIGLTVSTSACPVPSSQVTAVLAEQSGVGGSTRASAWHKNFNASYPDSGLYRWHDNYYNGSNNELNATTLKLAFYKFADGKGIKAALYSNASLTMPYENVRIDNNIDFDWGYNRPDYKIETWEYSIRWAGNILPKYNTGYTFYTQTDGGVRLWVGDQLIIDKWDIEGYHEERGIIELKVGRGYSIKMEYRNNGGSGTARLLWGNYFRPEKEVIQKENLYYDKSFSLISIEAGNKNEIVPNEKISIKMKQKANFESVSMVARIKPYLIKSDGQVSTLKLALKDPIAGISLIENYINRITFKKNGVSVSFTASLDDENNTPGDLTDDTVIVSTGDENTGVCFNKGDICEIIINGLCIPAGGEQQISYSLDVGVYGALEEEQHMQEIFVDGLYVGGQSASDLFMNGLKIKYIMRNFI